MFAAIVLGALVGSASAISSGCSTSGPASCSSGSDDKFTRALLSGQQNASCCTETPGGLLLQTQFWDYEPATGPDDSWTIHGLWGDNCDGTYEENCDPSRAYTNIGDLLDAQGASDTHDYMNTYWVNDPDDGSNEEFWEHEWATHGTCYSTLEPGCLPSGSKPKAEAVAFFETVVKLFKTLPTYKWLEDANITPGDSEYDWNDVEAALKKGGGVTPQVTCKSGNLNAISWYFNLKGSLIDGEFVPIDSPEKSSCSGSIKYPSKSSGNKNRKRYEAL
ncbi:hypothetical protein PLICRDRAFT_175444 [Plicaturopsis crispa FD-325 SS-3]|nr:hypothetical protein PLICRDRAFT_175444 [Plicaturopsis crispa FD-325 SS-3]